MVQEIAGSLTQAADLLARGGAQARRDSSGWSEAHLRDAFAARVKVMHCVYVAAHAVSVGLVQNELAERFDTRSAHFSVPAEELRRRVLDVEQIAYSYIQGHYPQALDAGHREPVDETRIPTAIAAWDIHAQRVLVREPTTHALARVAGAAFTASIHAHRLWRAAAQAGHVDAGTVKHEIVPALETMIEQWDGAHTLFRRLTHRLDSSPAALNHACWELPDAMRALSRDPLAQPIEPLDQSVNLAVAVRSLHRFHATVAGVAGVVHEVTRDVELLVDARGANNLITAGAEEVDRWGRPALSAVVAPGDLLCKRAIPAPEVLRARMEEVAHSVAATSRAVLRTTLTASDGNRGAPSSALTAVRIRPASRQLQTAERLERSSERTPVHGVHIAR